MRTGRGQKHWLRSNEVKLIRGESQIETCSNLTAGWGQEADPESSFVLESWNTNPNYTINPCSAIYSKCVHSNVSLGNSISSFIQTFKPLRVLVCEKCIVYCADRIRCFPGKNVTRKHNTSQETHSRQHADFSNTNITPAGS